jgi:hypothetical protein
MGHVLDDTGIYTDTAEFFHLVPNCTNISVGYQNEHTKKETLNKMYIEALRDSLIAADWTQLDFTPPKPDPVVPALTKYADTDYRLFEANQRSLFEKPDLDVGPLQIADFLYDYSDRLPQDLRDRALKLAQKIYKRFEQ